MSGIGSVQSFGILRTKTFVFAAIAAMAIYVLYHFERFLIDWSHPVWQHYAALGVFILTHGVAGATAMILAPMQFPIGCANASPSCIAWWGASMSARR